MSPLFQRDRVRTEKGHASPLNADFFIRGTSPLKNPAIATAPIISGIRKKYKTKKRIKNMENLPVEKLKKMSTSDLTWLISHLWVIAGKNKSDEKFKSEIKAYLSHYEREDIEEEPSLNLLFSMLEIAITDMFLE